MSLKDFCRYISTYILSVCWWVEGMITRAVESSQLWRHFRHFHHYNLLHIQTESPNYWFLGFSEYFVISNIKLNLLKLSIWMCNVKYILLLFLETFWLFILSNVHLQLSTTRGPHPLGLTCVFLSIKYLDQLC